MVLALNATPIENGLDELWTQLSLVERAIFPSWPAFEALYIRTVSFVFCRRCGKYQHKYKMGPHMDSCKLPVTHRWRPDFDRVVGFNDLPGVRSLIRDRYIRRTAAMVNEQLPPIVVTSVYVELDREQRRAYDAVRTDATMDPQVKVGELVRRAAFAFEGTKIRSTKTDALVEIMRELGDTKCVVVAESKVLIRHVSKVLQDQGLNVGEITGDTSDDQRDAIVRSFTHEKMQVICGTSAIERGLNLQAGGVIVNLDIPWNPAKWIQRVGRLRRIGSKHTSVRVINVIARETVDDLVIERVYEKLGVFNAIFEGDVDEVAFAGKAEVRTLITEATK
jgi:SNF2 family DNA or RNA helicase